MKTEALRDRRQERPGPAWRTAQDLFLSFFRIDFGTMMRRSFTQDLTPTNIDETY